MIIVNMNVAALGAALREFLMFRVYQVGGVSGHRGDENRYMKMWVGKNFKKQNADDHQLGWTSEYD